MPQIIEIDKYKPDYDKGCENCGQVPTVTAVKDGKIIYSSEMCGPCTWGDSRTIDPSEW